GDGHRDPFTRARLLAVRDSIVCRVRRAVGQRAVYLVDRLDRRETADGRDGVALEAFAGAVVEDDHVRLERAEEDGIVALIETVVAGLVDVDGPDAIVRTHEPLFDIPRRVAAEKHAEAAGVEAHRDAVRVVGRIDGFRRGALTDRRVRSRKTIVSST